MQAFVSDELKAGKSGEQITASLVTKYGKLTIPAAEVRRTGPQIDRHVEDLPLQDRHQLPLRMPDLVMQPAQHVFRRARVVVLHELDVDPGRLVERAPVIAFQEKAAGVPKDPRLDDQHVGNLGAGHAHQIRRSARSLSRYSP